MMEYVLGGLGVFWILFLAIMALSGGFDDNSAARHNAIQKANALCGPKGADVVDIQGENRVAFVCRKDVPSLRTLGY